MIYGVTIMALCDDLVQPACIARATAAYSSNCVSAPSVPCSDGARGALIAPVIMAALSLVWHDWAQDHDVQRFRNSLAVLLGIGLRLAHDIRNCSNNISLTKYYFNYHFDMKSTKVHISTITAR